MLHKKNQQVTVNQPHPGNQESTANAVIGNVLTFLSFRQAFQGTYELI
ncbi:MAG: hypothetical protein HC836_17410 [Richelia sp. RM2_1_2]|nr:hypothetical protein [Richelia sp. SM2_1_7]NJM21989.1 hypothetical protein [Richelia sp. SM1_7_0]NJN06781.1 hypothetical protein [Richelia sp. RM1_1_1]NJO28094.1 hypothetical protein [Richelia sp. SL_2_1]NJO59982.1 hypothetical protein [Richelia sp. RM2_1_2]NJS16348.1 hypothetical protein [Nostocaceae cyanobacterium CSU_2_110]